MTKGKKPTKASSPSASNLSDSFTPERAKDVLAREVSDGTVAVMRLDNDQFFLTIDGIAAELWTLIDGKSTLREIKDKLIAKHNPPVSKFDKDVAKFIKELQNESLLAV